MNEMHPPRAKARRDNISAPDGPRSRAQSACHGETGAYTIVEWSFRHVEWKPPRNEG